MTRILFIARYRDPTMQRKVDYLAQKPGLELLFVKPARWQDELLAVQQENTRGRYRQLALAMHGNPADPHRATYHTLDFAMRTFQPQIIHAEEEPDSLSALQIVGARRLFAPRAKLILHTWQNIDRPKTLPVRWVMERTLAAADLVFCANQEAVPILRRHGFRGSLPVLPAVGVDTEVFVPCTGRQPLTTDAPRIGYVGRFVPEKGLDTLLYAFASLHQQAPGARLRLIGDGVQRETLRALAVALGVAATTEFVAPMPPAQIAQALCALDILVLPSRTTPVWKEQLGRVLLEAMACGVPVIGANSGAIPEVIGNAGMIFPEGDAASLGAQLGDLVRSPALGLALRQLGLQRIADHYSQRHLAEQITASYRQLTA